MHQKPFREIHAVRLGVRLQECSQFRHHSRDMWIVFELPVRLLNLEHPQRAPQIRVRSRRERRWPNVLHGLGNPPVGLGLRPDNGRDRCALPLEVLGNAAVAIGQRKVQRRVVRRARFGGDIGSVSHEQVDNAEIPRLRRPVQGAQPVRARPVDGCPVLDQFQRKVETIRRFVASGEAQRRTAVVEQCVGKYESLADKRDRLVIAVM